MQKLDIIVTHYTEGWDIVGNFFRMMDAQRCLNWNDVRVIVIHDGEECPALPELNEPRPYRIDQVTIKHGGISAARNKGIQVAEAEWIMFCDCDDMFSEVYSLRHYLEVLPTRMFDMLYSGFVSEMKKHDGTTILYPWDKNNIVFIHGKMFRRAFLLKENLWFKEGLDYCEDSAFLAIFNCRVNYKRTGKLSGDRLYVWSWREGSATNSIDSRDRCIAGVWVRNKMLTVESERLNLPSLKGTVCRTVFDCYNALNREEKSMPEFLLKIRREFREYWCKWHDVFWQNTDSEMQEIWKASTAERDRGIQEATEMSGKPFDNGWRKSVSVWDWLKEIESEG